MPLLKDKEIYGRQLFVRLMVMNEIFPNVLYLRLLIKAYLKNGQQYPNN
jgi:hypothetical protein